MPIWDKIVIAKRYGKILKLKEQLNLDKSIKSLNLKKHIKKSYKKTIRLILR